MRAMMTFALATAAASMAGPAARGSDFEVMTFWTSPSEAAALAVVRDAYVADGHTWLQRDFSDSALLRHESTSQFVTGTASAAAQWAFGQSISEMADAGMMTPIGDLVPTEGWADILSPFVVENVSTGGEFYLAPVGVHVENMMWMNRAVLEESGLAVPATWDDLIAAGRVLKARGITPISLPKDDWTRNILIRAVIADVAGRHEDLRKPGLTWDELVDHPAMEGIVETMIALRDLVTPPGEEVGWTKAAFALAEGRAGFYFMGDWVRGEFAAHGIKVDEQILCAVPPGNRWLQSLVIDGFYFPVLDDPHLVDAQGRLVEILMDPRVQLEFALKKGSVPVRTDVDFKKLDSCAADAHARMSDPSVAFHRLEPLTPDWNGNIRYVVTLLESLTPDGGNRTDVMAKLREIRKDSPAP